MYLKGLHQEICFSYVSFISYPKIDQDKSVDRWEKRSILRLLNAIFY
jgi:hypothetical protein